MRKDDSESGMVTAEFAMTIPVVLMVLFLVFSTGSAMVTQMRVTDAAREAARGYAMGVARDEVADVVTQRAGDAATLTTQREGNMVTVSVSAPIDPVWGVVGLTAHSSITAFVEWGDTGG